MGSDFSLGEVFPPLRVSEKLPTIEGIQYRALTAQRTHRAIASNFFHRRFPNLTQSLADIGILANVRFAPEPGLPSESGFDPERTSWTQRLGSDSFTHHAQIIHAEAGLPIYEMPRPLGPPPTSGTSMPRAVVKSI